MFCWIIPKKLYLTEGIYETERKGWFDKKSFTTIAVSVMIAARFIELDPGILFETNYIIASILLAVCFATALLLIKWYSKSTRKKMLKQIKIHKEQVTIAKFKPKGKGAWLAFIFMLYVAIFAIPQCLELLIDPNLDDLLIVFGMAIFIVSMPAIGFLCTDPIVDGERLKRIIS